MILYTLGKRIKNFVKVKIYNSDYRVLNKEHVISGEKFLQKNGSMKNGKVIWFYNDDKIKAECNYKNDMLEGVSVYYYKTGEVMARENYQRNKLEGVTRRYYENGRLKSEEKYKRGNLIFKRNLDVEGNETIIIRE